MATEDAPKGPKQNTPNGTPNVETRNKVTIKPIKTQDDTGTPGRSIAGDMQRVLDLMEDERHLVANELYQDIKRRIADFRKRTMGKEEKKITPPTNSKHAKQRSKRGWLDSLKVKPVKADSHDEQQDITKAETMIKKSSFELDQLEKRAPLFLKTKHDMDDSDDWTLAQTIFGVTTYYRREKDGSLSIKLEGDIKGIPLFEQVAVLREIDLHSTWAPFVTSSLTLAQLDKLDTVGWIMVGLPNFGIARDGCFRCIGCDCTKEDGSILIYGQGLRDRAEGVAPENGTEFLDEDPRLESLDVPPVPTRLGSGRMTIRNFEARVNVLAPDHACTKVLANINPNLAFIPQALLEFVLKKVCGFLLNKLQSAAKKTVKDPVRNIHAQRMRDDAAFYQDWLLPKFEAVAKQMGWEMPTVMAFELTEEQQMEAAKLKERRASKMHSFSDFEASKIRADSEGVVSTRSAPGLFRRRSSADGISDDDLQDNVSEISSASGTSSSIWKSNPIATYLRELEMKTQKRKNQDLLESRQKAAARLQPKPLPQDKIQRLQELKRHKERKMRLRSASSDASFDSLGSIGGSGALSPVDEDGSDTAVSERRQPYSPISAALESSGRWTRLSAVAFLVLLLFVLLHVDKMLPSFFDRGDAWWVTLMRDLVVFVYIGLCGAIHFLLCDVQLIYAFEAFELGMKSGEQVKTFYRGQIRVLVAVFSGTLVSFSIIKGVIVALLKTFVILTVRYYSSLGGNSGERDVAESVVSAIEDGENALENAVSDLNPNEVQSLISTLPGLAFGVCSTIFSFIHAVFEWQMNVFIRSNPIGRIFESLLTGTYGMWARLLVKFARKGGFFFNSLTDYETIDESLQSWRGDAIGTVRGLLLYTAVFLLVILALLDVVAKSYRHQTVQPRVPSAKDHNGTTEGREKNAAGNVIPLRMPPRNPISSSKSTDSSSRRRLKFRRTRRENLEDEGGLG